MNGKKAKVLRGKCGHRPATEVEYVVGRRTDKEIIFLDGRRMTISRLTCVLAQGCGRSLYKHIKRTTKNLMQGRA